jgi:hemerythrin-like domain-containing protein
MEHKMTEQLAEWHAEHVTFARLLDLLEAEIAAFHEGNRPNYDLMSDIVYYMRSFCDRFHHPREDIAFMRLAERDPTTQLVVSRLQQEHRVIARAGEELTHRLDEIAGDVMAPRGALEAAAATYLVYYRHHLNTEERDVMPRAAQILTPQDWAAVGEQHPTPDPLFGDDVEVRFRELRRRITLEAEVPRSEPAGPPQC